MAYLLRVNDQQSPKCINRGLPRIRKPMNTTISPIHPGEILLEDFMNPHGLSQYRLAQDIDVSPIRICQIIHGQRSISVDTAMSLARYFGTSAAVTEFSLNNGRMFTSKKVQNPSSKRSIVDEKRVFGQLLPALV